MVSVLMFIHHFKPQNILSDSPVMSFVTIRNLCLQLILVWLCVGSLLLLFFLRCNPTRYKNTVIPRVTIHILFFDFWVTLEDISTHVLNHEQHCNAHHLQGDIRTRFSLCYIATAHTSLTGMTVSLSLWLASTVASHVAAGPIVANYMCWLTTPHPQQRPTIFTI